MDGPLNGVTVVALEQAVAAPIASRHLGDLGARVIKVERVDGGDFARGYDADVAGVASHFVWLNRNKESLAVDIKDPRGRAVLDSLLARADVFIQNMGSGAARRASLDPESLLGRYPRLIACGVSGYGADGPYSSKAAYDLTIQAETGSIAITGSPGALAKPGVAIADIGAGMYVYSTVLAALYERERSGRGRAINVSMFDAMIEWMGYSLNHVRHTGREQLPHGVGTEAISPYGAFVTSDQQRVVAGVQNEREWERFCRIVIGRPDLLDHPDLAGNRRRVRARATVDAACAAAFAAMTLEEAVERLDEARIAWGLVRQVSEVLQHPQLLERDRLASVGVGGTAVAATKPVAEVEGWAYPMGAVPSLGEHTRAILRELGLGAEDVDRLVGAGVVGVS